VEFSKLRVRLAVRLAWVLLAALPVFGGWKSSGPFGGSARSIAIDPQNGSLLLVGARDSLLFRSDDAATSWKALPFPSLTPGVFNALLIHPRESGHFYAGLDAGDSSDSGLYESRDGGEHWLKLPGISGLRIESLAMSPQDPSVLAVGTQHGVYLSSDGGEAWRRISVENNPEMQDITALAFDPAHWNTIYAGTPHLPWKTSDAGATWHPIHEGLIDDSDIFSLRVDPARPERLFASACSGIYRSETAGESWTKLTGIPGTQRRTHIIAQDPANSDTVFAGTTLGLLKSSDAGRTWRHPVTEQINWLAFDPSDARILYLATEDAGILKSTDGGETFHAVNTGFANHHLTQIAAASGRLYASSSYEGLHGGLFVSTDGGFDWSLRANRQALLGQNLNSLVSAPGPSGLLFAAGDDAVLKSADAGKTWVRLLSQPRVAAPDSSSGRIRIHSLQALRTSKLILLAGTQAGLFRSPNSGLSWERVTADGVAHSAVLNVYAPPAGASRVAARTVQGLFVSDDAGVTWRAASLPDTSFYLYDLALPVERGPILAATSRGVLRTSDSGTHWDLITEGVPAATVDSIRFHPQRTLDAYLVQYGKVYHSSDGGVSWKSVSADGLEQSSIRSLWFAPDLPGRIFALTAARGALLLDSTVAATDAKQETHGQ